MARVDKGLFTLTAALILVVPLATVPVAYANHDTTTPQLPGLSGREVLYVLAKESVLVVDPVSLKVLKTLKVGGCFSALAPAADGKLVYAANACLDAVVVIDGATHTVIDLLKVGKQPASRLNLSPDLKTVWVRTIDGVSVIDAEKREFITNIPTGDASQPGGRPGPAGGMSFVPGTGGRPSLLYVINPRDGTVTAIDVDKRTAVATIPVGKGARFGIAYSKASDKVYVTNPGSEDISVIDPSTNRVVKTIPVGRKGLGTLWFMHNGRYGTIDSRHERGGGDALVVIDSQTDSIVGAIELRREGVPTEGPLNPTRVFFTPDDRLGFALFKTSPYVAVVDVAQLRIVKLIELTPLKKEVLYRCSVFLSQDGRTAYVTSAVEETITVIDVDSLAVRAIIKTNEPTCSIYSFRVPGGPLAVAPPQDISGVTQMLLAATTVAFLSATVYFARKSRKTRS